MATEPSSRNSVSAYTSSSLMPIAENKYTFERVKKSLSTKNALAIKGKSLQRRNEKGYLIACSCTDTGIEEFSVSLC